MSHKYEETLNVIAWILVALILVYISPCASAELKLVPDDWTKEDTRRQWAYTTIVILDAGQTADIQNHDGIKEVSPAANMLLGDQPSSGATAAYFAGSALLNYAVSAMLKPKHRAWFQRSTIAINGAVVANNYQLGLRWGF